MPVPFLCVPVLPETETGSGPSARRRRRTARESPPYRVLRNPPRNPPPVGSLHSRDGTITIHPRLRPHPSARTMPVRPDTSVTQWIDRLKAGDPDAAQELWERYFRRLVGLARKKLHAAPRP